MEKRLYEQPEMTVMTVKTESLLNTVSDPDNPHIPEGEPTEFPD